MDIITLQNWAYVPDLPDDIGSIRKLLLEYSKIPADDIDHHILRVVCPDPRPLLSVLVSPAQLVAKDLSLLKREDAWKVSRFPCVGRWKFLRLIEQNDSCYQQVLFRLKLNGSRDAFLDLGCCVGQVLRQLRHDGVQGSQLFGTDVKSKFVDIGYALFQDQDSIGATFVIGDMLDPEDTRLDGLLRKVTIIYAGSFFHLFSWTQQLYIGKRLVGFLKQGTKNALIYGRHIGTTKRGGAATSDASPYLHDKKSFQQLWHGIGDLTRTRWVVELEPAGGILDGLPQVEKDAQTVTFIVHQVS